MSAAEESYSAAVAAAVASLGAGIRECDFGSAVSGRRQAMEAMGRTALIAAAPVGGQLNGTGDTVAELLGLAQARVAKCKALLNDRRRDCARAMEAHARAKATYVRSSSSAEEAMSQGSPAESDPWLQELKLREAAQTLHDVRSEWTEAGGCAWRDQEIFEAEQTAVLRRALGEQVAAWH